MAVISTYRIHLFAGLAERTGAREFELEAPEPCSVSQLKERVGKHYPTLKAQIDTALVAIDKAYADDDMLVSPTQEIALIPPVGGGAPAKHFYQVTGHPIDVSEAYQQLEDVYCGGTVLFCGTVREFTGADQTTHLVYEAYEAMALEQMKRIANDVERDHPGTHTLQWHRIGELRPTDIAVICAAASPHRDDAFVAARTLIERLKKEVPIWKKEHFKDGNTIWQANER